jgi:uncharacterized membrane protein
MTVHEIVARATVILYGCFLLWKLVAMVSGLSYRYKWVRIVDVITLSLVIGLSVMVQIVWKTLYHPGDASLFYTFAACYFGLSALFTGLSYIMDKAWRTIRESRNRKFIDA